MAEEEKIRVIRFIEQIQAERGDAGCFAKLYPVLSATAAKLDILRTFIGEDEYMRRMAALRNIVSGLPDFHNEQVLIDSLEKINRLTSFNPTI